MDLVNLPSCLVNHILALVMGKYEIDTRFFLVHNNFIVQNKNVKT